MVSLENPLRIMLLLDYLVIFSSALGAILVYYFSWINK